MSNLVIIGKILKPRGLAGEIKVQILSNRASVFDGLGAAWIGGVEYKVVKSSVQNGAAFFVLDGVNNSESAEKLRGKLVEVGREMLVLEDDEILAEDIVGFSVVDENGKVLGKLRGVENYGGGDIFECAGERGYFSFPNEDNFVAETNMKDKKIVVYSRMLEEES